MAHIACHLCNTGAARCAPPDAHKSAKSISAPTNVHPFQVCERALLSSAFTSEEYDHIAFAARRVGRDAPFAYFFLDVRRATAFLMCITAACDASRKIKQIM